MTVKELQEKLKAYDPENEVIICVLKEGEGYDAYQVRDIDDGWKPSNICTISTNQEHWVGG